MLALLGIGGIGEKKRLDGFEIHAERMRQRRALLLRRAPGLPGRQIVKQQCVRRDPADAGWIVDEVAVQRIAAVNLDDRTGFGDAIKFAHNFIEHVGRLTELLEHKLE